MKIRKIVSIFCVCVICAISVLIGMDDANAFSSTARFNGERSYGGFGFTDGKGEKKTLFCADANWGNPEEGSVYVDKGDLVSFFDGYQLGNIYAGDSDEIIGKVSINKEQAKELVKRLGAIKYYYQNIVKIGKDNDELEHAIWYTEKEVYQDANPGSTVFGYHSDFAMPHYNDAKHWYDENKGAIKIEESHAWVRKSDGLGQPVFDITVSYIPFNYSLDMACENCDSKNGDSKAIVIQDTTNWDAIGRSQEIASVCKNLSGYFYKANYKTYCREEYHVYYPNANNKIHVQIGRFFTVNANKEELDVVDSSIPNFAPIRVKKIRQCKSGNLNGFKQNSDDEFKRCGGTIKIKYSESKYNYDGALVNRLVSFSSKIEGDMLTQQAEFDYVLKKGVYQYVRISDGYSLKTAPAEDKPTVYKDLKISNLPISFDAKTKPQVGFVYELPNTSKKCEDANSTIRKAYTKENNYISCSSGTAENVYKKENEHEKLADSACAKLYNTTSGDKFKKCVSERIDNKMGNCFNANDGKGKDDYLCNLPVINDCNESTAGKEGGEFEEFTWDKDEKKCILKLKCTKYKGKYYGPDGKTTSFEDYIQKCSGKPSIVTKCKEDDATCCDSSNYQKLGRDWNVNENKCCPEGYKYDVATKKCNPIEAETKCDINHLNCAGRPCCEDAEGHAFCGYRVEGVDICPGKPTIKPTESVYRTINPSAPFVSQNGENREVGSNWCSYSNGVYTCDSERGNAVVDTVIKQANNNEENALYIIDLDTETINRIRKYNGNHNYDDFEMNCDAAGNKCVSDFVHKVINDKVDGKCVSATNFYECANAN